MKRKVRILNYESVNRLKLETEEKFEKSLFQEQYASARYFLEEIRQNSERIRKMAERSGEAHYPSEHNMETVCNIIPFLGGRGTGKTSAMMSFSDVFRNQSDGEYLLLEYINSSFDLIRGIDELQGKIVYEQERSRIDQHGRPGSLQHLPGKRICLSCISFRKAEK